MRGISRIRFPTSPSAWLCGSWPHLLPLPRPRNALLRRFRTQSYFAPWTVCQVCQAPRRWGEPSAQTPDRPVARSRFALPFVRLSH